MSSKRSTSGSGRPRSAHGAKEATDPGGTAVIRGSWYPDPFGAAAERWWDGGKWTQEVRGEAQAVTTGGALADRQGTGTSQANAAGRARVMAAGWYAWNASSMRYWDGDRWGEYRPRTGAELRTAQPVKQRLSRFVPLGYLAAVFFPLVGVAFGLVVVAQPGDQSPTRHGIQIIALSVVGFVLGLLLVRHR